MLKKISHITLFVNDQNEALDFYTKKLGFKVHTDAMFGDFRWLTLQVPEQKELELVLMLANSNIDKALVGKQGGDKPFLNLETTDCYKDYEILVQHGITFTHKPEKQPWGLSACFLDLYGNSIYMCQYE